MTVTCTKTGGSIYVQGASVPISLIAEYGLPRCTTQTTSAVTSVVNVVGAPPVVTLTPQQPSVRICPGSTSVSALLDYTVDAPAGMQAVSYDTKASVPQGRCQVTRQGEGRSSIAGSVHAGWQCRCTRVGNTPLR